MKLHYGKLPNGSLKMATPKKKTWWFPVGSWPVETK